jgi:hypothetical protein
MARKKVEFNSQIYQELVQYTEKNKKLPNIHYIALTYGVSNRAASAYYFAVNNRFEITNDLNSATTIRNLKLKVSDIKYNLKLAERSVKELQAQVDFLEAIELLKGHEFKKITISAADPSIDEVTAISLLSDAHVDEIVDPRTVNGLNEYNPTIAERRVRLYFSRMMYMIRTFRKGGFKIDHLVLGILGDMISGYINEDLIESNSMSPTEASVFIESLLCDGIKFLSEEGEFKSIKIVMIRGNHGRTTAKKRFSTGYKNSYEYMMYTQIHKLFKYHLTGYDNIEFIIPQSEYAYVDIYHTTNGFSHGDHFNYRGGVGGVVVPMMNWIYRRSKIIPADKHFIGHWHQRWSLPSGVVNSSLIGYNAFAMGISAQPEPPQMELQLVDSKRGYTVSTPVILTEW